MNDYQWLEYVSLFMILMNSSSFFCYLHLCQLHQSSIGPHNHSYFLWALLQLFWGFKRKLYQYLPRRKVWRFEHFYSWVSLGQLDGHEFVESAEFDDSVAFCIKFRYHFLTILFFLKVSQVLSWRLWIPWSRWFSICQCWIDQRLL